MAKKCKLLAGTPPVSIFMRFLAITDHRNEFCRALKCCCGCLSAVKRSVTVKEDNAISVALAVKPGKSQNAGQTAIVLKKANLLIFWL